MRSPMRYFAFQGSTSNQRIVTFILLFYPYFYIVNIHYNISVSRSGSVLSQYDSCLCVRGSAHYTSNPKFCC